MPQRTAASSGATETAVAVTHEQSLKVTQNILVALLSELAFVRGIFPEDSFSVSKSGKVGIPDFTFRLSRQQPLVSCLSPRGPRHCRGAWYMPSPSSVQPARQQPELNDQMAMQQMKTRGMQSRFAPDLCR